MSNTGDLGIIKEYIEAVGSSSTRVRAILVIQIITSIIVASVVWNQQLWGWIRAEIGQTKAIGEWYKREAPEKSAPQIKVEIQDELLKRECRPESIDLMPDCSRLRGAGRRRSLCVLSGGRNDTGAGSELSRRTD